MTIWFQAFWFQIDFNLHNPYVKVKQADELESILTKQFIRFITQRAESFQAGRGGEYVTF